MFAHFFVMCDSDFLEGQREMRKEIYIHENDDKKYPKKGDEESDKR